jgi:PAS domain S-box-containing protein
MRKSMKPPAEHSEARRASARGDLLLADCLRLFVEGVEDYAIFMLDPAGHVVSWNKGAERLKGYQEEEILGEHFSRFYTTEDLERRLPASLLKIAQIEGRAEDEGWRVRADGSRFWARVSITAVRGEDGQLLGFGKVTHDLSERKAAELAVRAGQDQERKSSAASLCDRTSSSLATLVSKLHQAKKRSDRLTSQLIDDCIAVAQFVLHEIRTGSYLPHPPSLETDGLLITLRSYLEHLARQKSVLIDMDFPVQLERLPESAEMALYRVATEGLTSLLQLSGNSRANVSLTVEEGSLTLQVGDEGQALSRETLEEARTGSGELGVALTGIRERLLHLGGSVQIAPARAGTTLCATLPLKEPRRSSALHS